jgi:hypothetical protein
MSTLSCLNEKKNIGVSTCKRLPQQLKGFFLTPDNFELTLEEASSATALQDAIYADQKRDRVYFYPLAVNMENLSEENIREETPLSIMAVRDGRYRFRMMFQVGLPLHQAIFSHKNYEGRIILLDNNRELIFTQKANGNLAGFTLDLFDPEKLMFNDGSVASKSAVYFSLEDNLELDKDGKMVKGDFFRSLNRLTDAALTIQGTPTATEIVVAVTNDLDGTPVLGLTDADFVLLDAAGAAQTIDTAAEPNNDGVYTLTGTALVSGTLNLVGPSTISVQGFEGIPTEVTIA